ncbi:MAG: aminomethyltransferase family protein, partial [Gammaproteobacteria bacterium]|nr:aminomethyltransferase family protein [Gammaproteobacteria bacterium]
MAAPNLQEAIEKAGSPVKLLWKPNAKRWTVPVIKPEYVGWREEQAAWRDGVALSDLSHHMSDLFVEGPDATRLLRTVSANDYESFEIGRAKQFIPVTAEGHLITDGILFREAQDRYVLSGVPAAQTWVQYHALKDDYAVTCALDPDSGNRKVGNPVLFRYQIQGPRAIEMLASAFGGPLPTPRFFHSAPVTLAGRTFRCFRHGMAGQPGYEFIGDWRDAEAVKDHLMEAGKAFGMAHVGGLAYYTNGIESGWIPTPTPGIFSAPELADYRRFISLFSYEGQKPLHGSYFSENIEDYYVSPWEMGYSRSISFNHDFIGRAALEKARDQVRRTKVTLVLNVDDVRRVFGDDPGFLLSYARYRIESGNKRIGMTFYTGFIDPVGTVLALSLIDRQYAQAGTEVTLVWGEHPGSGTAPDA